MSVYFTFDIIYPKYHNHYQPIADVLGNEQNNKFKRKSLTKMFGTKKKKDPISKKNFKTKVTKL